MLIRSQLLLAAMLLACTIYTPLYAQKKIVRTPEENKILGLKELTFEKKRNVLQNYVWASPDVECRKLTVKDNAAQLEYGGLVYSLLIDGDKLTLTSAGGKALTSYKRVTNKCYPTAAGLVYKPVVYERYIEKMVYTVKTVPVQK